MIPLAPFAYTVDNRFHIGPASDHGIPLVRVVRFLPTRVISRVVTPLDNASAIIFANITLPTTFVTTEQRHLRITSHLYIPHSIISLRPTSQRHLAINLRIVLFIAINVIRQDKKVNSCIFLSHWHINRDLYLNLQSIYRK